MRLELSLSALKIAKFMYERLYDKYERICDGVLKDTVSHSDHLAYQLDVVTVLEIGRNHGKFVS